jgi:hypothetical protein
MEQMRLPISVTLIKPSAISTPYKDHARNLMDKPATLPQPLVRPERGGGRHPLRLPARRP